MKYVSHLNLVIFEKEQNKGYACLRWLCLLHSSSEVHNQISSTSLRVIFSLPHDRKTIEGYPKFSNENMPSERQYFKTTNLFIFHFSELIDIYIMTQNEF